MARQVTYAWALNHTSIERLLEQERESLRKTLEMLVKAAVMVEELEKTIKGHEQNLSTLSRLTDIQGYHAGKGRKVIVNPEAVGQMVDNLSVLSKIVSVSRIDIPEQETESIVSINDLLTTEKVG